MKNKQDVKTLKDFAQKSGYNIGICAKILNRRGEILLIKRNTGDNYSGVWEMPGGAVETSESLEDAVKREIAEETGLAVRQIKYLDYFDFPNIETNKTKRKFCFEASVHGEVKLSHEHQEYKWFSSSDIRNLKVQGQEKDYDIWLDHYRIVAG
jgi:8-oxo-dGTP diphosphatase